MKTEKKFPPEKPSLEGLQTFYKGHPAAKYRAKGNTDMWIF